MTLVTGVVQDSTGKKDSREWKVWSPVYSQAEDTGNVVSTRVRQINVTAGNFRAEIDPGVVVLENPDGDRWTVTVPETDIDLWDLIELSVALPPDTPAGAIQDVVWEYLETHPIEAGPPGPSAYDVAVSEGFVGTKSEWLDSLEGPPGAGASAYEVAVAEGFVGDEAAWLASLEGPTGPAVDDVELVGGDLQFYVDGTPVGTPVALPGAGDMTKAVYDPTNINGSAFSQDNMVSGTANKNFTAAEQSKLNGIEALADVTDAANVAAAGAQMTAEKNANNGYAGLDSAGLIPSTLLPSYVDDVIEAANFAALTGGVAGKIYVTLDTNKTYRWSGSAFVEISASPGSTDAVTEGSTNLYYTQARADARVSAGITGKADKTTTVSAGTGLSGGGDLSANRTLSVTYGTTAGTAAQGNDARLSDARTPTAHSHAISDVTGLQSSLDAILLVTANTQTGTTYTPVIGDASKVVEMNNASANTLTVPPNSSVAFPVGTIIEVHQLGAGQTTIAAGAGVTLRSPGSKLKITGQYSSATLRKRATDEWVVAGELSA